MPAAINGLHRVPLGAAPDTNGHSHINGNYTNGHSNLKESRLSAETDALTPLDSRFDSIPSTISAFARGEFVLVLDSPHRENEADLIIRASSLTPSQLAFMIRHTSGYICAPMPAARADALGLPLMVPAEYAQDPTRTAYTVTVDADLPPPGFTTGISAADRTATCRLLADAGAQPASFRRPGHVLPLRAKAGGVRERRGHTEAAVDLCRLAGDEAGVGVICEMVREGEAVEGKAEIEGGGMMRREECLEFARRWGIRCCTIEDLVRYLEATEGKLEVEGKDY